MLKDINTLIGVIENSIKWADRYGRETFPREEMKEYRRKLRRYADSLSTNCSMAAYGESQVGKSYLMSSLLSAPDKPFVIENNGKTYSFIDDLNPSGGKNSKTESTGVVTRFTLRNDNPRMKDFVKIKNLSVADLIMLIADSYYNDLKIDASKILRYDVINTELRELQSLWSDSAYSQQYLTEDDVKDICDYLINAIGGMAASISQSDFRKIIPPVIEHVRPENWIKIFSLLWNQNEELNRLFSTIINDYKKLDFNTEVYVPFDAVLRNKGTLLKIEWLDGIFGNAILSDTDIPVADVYNAKGDLIASKFSKSTLSALIAELTFVLPGEIAKDRLFLEKVDLLDFPGARSREKFKESEIQTVLPTILRRGKVAYLFNKYSSSLNISGVMFCHHNDQKAEATLGDTINTWIEENIGKTPAERAETLMSTNGISPLFFIATKFNIELERVKTDIPDNKDSLAEHWGRFKTVYPEIIKPATWLTQWVTKGGIFSSEAFQSVYLLRDFYWSGKNRVFDGYSDGVVKSPETNVHVHEEYPEFFEDLKASFLGNDFVKKHFRNASEAWLSVATPNRDGSKEIIRDLNAISGVIDNARQERYRKKVCTILKEILNKLNVYYEPEDVEKNNARICKIIRDIRLSLDRNVGARPETFGKIIDKMMVSSSELRKLAYDIAVLHVERPVDSDEIVMIRTQAGIEPTDSKDTAIQKLCRYYLCSAEELPEFLSQDGIDIESVVMGSTNLATTVADVISNRILDYWIGFINNQSSQLEKLIPHADEVVFMLQTLCLKLGVRKKISDKIDIYTRIFQKEDDLPNAIADFSSLTLNNFVSSVGQNYMTDEVLGNIRDKGQACGVEIERVPNYDNSRKNVYEALQAFDDAQDLGVVAIKTLMKLPFWNNYQKWKGNIVRGLLFVADISHVDPVANGEMKQIIEECNTIQN